MRSLVALALLGLGACTQLPPQDVPGPERIAQPLVVVDIDGTLTPDVLAIGQARPDAAELLSVLVRKGYGLVYLTARVPVAQAGLPDWLRQQGFPAGPLHVAQSAAERADPGAFKARWLTSYANSGWRLTWAYGDSSSDFDAYAKAGIAREQVFALRRRGDADCQPGRYARCLAGWDDHRRFIESLPDAR